MKWGSTYYETLSRKEEEVVELTHEIATTVDPLQSTHLAFQESQSRLDKVIVELEHVQSTPTKNPVQLYILVVGGEFASMVGNEGCDDVVVTSVQDVDAVGTEEVREIVEMISHGDLLLPARSESISSTHTHGNIGHLAVPHFQID